ncbi:ribonuclease HII [Eubacterium oxidoreducens]|uniref:Ribonuclease HII n=1 Tax=Eubacterium oxidoreducens TaxID=1732 RepID=A0A1G6C4W1_EUBOX|nr:ribonuclease HII [Eubacterium oxidoreducens]SDB27864.1 RNase HII [Eubacterium oxidoreducens]
MLKIGEIKDVLKYTPDEELPVFIKEYETDERDGVKKLIMQARKRYDRLLKEKERIYQLQEYERRYANCDYICGIDEVGRGPFAGPVVTAAVILPKDCEILYINDSKKLSEKRREELFEVIKEKAIAYSIGINTAERIDEINILQATLEAMRKAINSLEVKPDILLNDAVTIPGVDIRQEAIIKGDAKSISIGAASIIAKVTRDHMMVEYDKLYPQYHFAENKGYGTEEHRKALREFGPCPIHRRSFIHNYV